ncbi:MAG TPA: ATP-binding cassette domain-containing protein [Spongiibacteraceae bacterium]|nr:ATP-binding cassette domain-containing protein [Spongiibacteraceae bacterium]
MSDVLLRCENLGRCFAVPAQQDFWAVRGVDLNIYRGEALGIVGESGSGKSTLGRLLLGLHDKSEGDVYYRDARHTGEICLPRVYRRSDFQRWSAHMQMVFQDPYATLNPRFSIGASIAEPLLLRDAAKRPSRNEVQQRVAHALERVGLKSAMAQRYPHEFSGGQRQRIGLARALIAEPEILICDEPVSALDVSVQAQIVNLLAHLRSEMRLTLVFISHDLAVVRHLCDRVAVMQGGGIVELNETDALFADPQHEFTCRLLAAREINGRR